MPFSQSPLLFEFAPVTESTVDRPEHSVPERHVWTAPPWQELSELLQHWSGAVMCPACLCGGEAAGHNALRGSGPNQKHAFKDALTQTGSPDPRIDLVCITSSCPRQFLQNFKRRRRCLASPP